MVATYTYDVNGNRNSLTYGNGNSIDYAYNLANLVTSLNNKKGTTTLSNYAYTYYLNGNQATKSDNKGRLTSYNYDGLGRLTKEAESGTADAITKSYTFDAASNRASTTVSGAEAYNVGYKYDLNNRLTTETKEKSGTTEIAEYYYDNNGSTIAKQKGNLENSKGNETLSLSLDFTGSELYSYDGFDRMTGVQNSSGSSIYTYKPDGLRISKTVNGVKTTQVWEGQDIALEQDGNGEVTNRYIRGIGLISSDKNGWYLLNAHGDVVQLTDGSGNVSKEYSYDAFGNEKNIDANDSNLFRYCGEYFDKETGDIYLRARYYESNNGRFLMEDMNKSGLNWYVYCNNSPISLIDPTGNDAIVANKTTAVGGAGHMSSFVQDAKGNWNFFYWGPTVSVTPVKDSSVLSNPISMNKWLRHNGLNDSKDYDGFCYIPGDFTGSLKYYNELQRLYKESNSKDWYGLKKKLFNLKNDDYNLITNNCTEQTMEGLMKGKLSNGTSMEDYYERLYSNAVIPNYNLTNLQCAFMNYAYTESDFYSQVSYNLAHAKSYFSQLQDPYHSSNSAKKITTEEMTSILKKHGLV